MTVPEGRPSLLRADAAWQGRARERERRAFVAGVLASRKVHTRRRVARGWLGRLLFGSASRVETPAEEATRLLAQSRYVELAPFPPPLP